MFCAVWLFRGALLLNFSSRHQEIWFFVKDLDRSRGALKGSGSGWMWSETTDPKDPSDSAAPARFPPLHQYAAHRTAATHSQIASEGQSVYLRSPNSITLPLVWTLPRAVGSVLNVMITGSRLESRAGAGAAPSRKLDPLMRITAGPRLSRGGEGVVVLWDGSIWFLVAVFSCLSTHVFSQR